MNLLLNVKYEEQDIATSYGAKWDNNAKSFYINDFQKINTFSKWINEFNIICENLYIFKMEIPCWKCGENTCVICLGSNISFAKEDNFKVNKNLLLFSYVENLPNQIKIYLKDNFNFYKPYSKTTSNAYFYNHCTHCKSIQGDNYLHEIPEQSFYKKLCYIDYDSTSYFKISNNFIVPITARLPYYDEFANSFKLHMEYLKTGIENRSSLNVNQQLINRLFSVSNYNNSIFIDKI